MINDLVFRDANVEDIKYIVEIVKSGNGSQIDKIIYGQKGIYKYIEDRILNINLNTIYKVVEKDREIVGAMELRIFKNEVLFLNYIAVRNDIRNCGIGKFMIRKLILESNMIKPYKYIELDVFKDNRKAYKWYTEMGLKRYKASNWINIKYNSNRIYKNVIDKYEILTDSYYKNGFDIVQVTLCNKEYNVGVMGDKWFRIYEDELDEDIIEFLTSIDNRSILSICNFDKVINIDNSEIKIIRTSYRMKAKIENLIENII